MREHHMTAKREQHRDLRRTAKPHNHAARLFVRAEGPTRPLLIGPVFHPQFGGWGSRPKSEVRSPISKKVCEGRDAKQASKRAAPTYLLSPIHQFGNATPRDLVQ